MRPGQNLSINLSGETDEGLKQLLLEGSTIFVTHPMTPLDILGARHDLGAGFVYHPRVKAIDGERIWEELEAGTWTGEQVKLRPLDGTPFRVGLQWEGDAQPAFKAWGVVGIDDPLIDDMEIAQLDPE